MRFVSSRGGFGSLHTRLMPFYTVYYNVGLAQYVAIDREGIIQHQNANFRTMLNAAIVTVNAAGGGLIFIVAGDYPVSERIILLSNVWLMGEGMWQTRLYLPAGQPAVTANYQILLASDQVNIRVSHLCLDCDRANNPQNLGHAYYAANCSGLDCFEVRVINCPRFGIFFTASDGETHHHWEVSHGIFDEVHEDALSYYIDDGEVYGMKMTDNYFTNVLQVAVGIGGPGADAYCGGGHICDNLFDEWNPDGSWDPVNPGTMHGQAIQTNGQGCHVADNVIYGFLRGYETQAANANFNEFVDNVVIGADLGTNDTREAVKINNGDHNLVADNVLIGPPTADIGGNGSMVRCESVDGTRLERNLLIRPAGNANTWFGFQEQAGQTTNSFYHRNQMVNMPHPIYDTIQASARFDRWSAPFVQGNDPEDRGWRIDAEAEYARTWLTLPDEVNEVQRIKIFGVAIVTEADAMRLEILVNGGASNEPFNTEAVAVVNHPSTTTNFAANDVIYWTVTATDDADVDDLEMNDSLEVKVVHEVAGNGDCATEAWIRSVEVEYG